MGMQKDKKIILLNNGKEHKKIQELNKEFYKCEICLKYNALYRHPDVIGFMCNGCANTKALYALEMVLGPCNLGYMDIKK